jgi:hypothetical protein
MELKAGYQMWDAVLTPGWGNVIHWLQGYLSNADRIAWMPVGGGRLHY